jgi:hypothetical protein
MFEGVTRISKWRDTVLRFYMRKFGICQKIKGGERVMTSFGPYMQDPQGGIEATDIVHEGCRIPAAQLNK